MNWQTLYICRLDGGRWKIAGLRRLPAAREGLSDAHLHRGAGDRDQHLLADLHRPGAASRSRSTRRRASTRRRRRSAPRRSPSGGGSAARRGGRWSRGRPPGPIRRGSSTARPTRRCATRSSGSCARRCRSTRWCSACTARWWRQGYDDPEGDLLARVREIVGPDVLVCAELDPHSHLTAKRVAAADFFTVFKEFPHTDFVERARGSVADRGRHARGARSRPVMSVFDCRMIDVFPTSRAADAGLRRPDVGDRARRSEGAVAVG